MLSTFFVVQILFSQFGLQLFHTQNFFPLYTWQIFHTEPSRFLELDLIFIHAIDNRRFNPPRNILALQTDFTQINFYTLTAKVLYIADDYTRTKNTQSIEHLNQLLLQGHQSVDWDLRHVNFEVIEYFETGKSITEKILGEFHAMR